MAKKLRPPIAITPALVEAAEFQIDEQSKRIAYFLTDYSVELLVDKMHSGEFEIPAYQREDTWEPARKSRFIESLLMNLTIPFLFFWEVPKTGKLEIVDGSQRLRTLQQFLEDNLVIGELETLTHLRGMKFSNLPEARQRKIKNRSIRAIILNEHADELARFEIFDRINTGSKIANKAEVRRGALIGPFLDMVIDLTKDSTFQGLAPVPKLKVQLREREELITRFFAYGDGLDGYRDRPSEFLFAYAKKMNAQFAEQPECVQKYTTRFHDTMAFVAKVFPYGFRRRAGLMATPRTRFEAIAIGSYLALQTNHNLAVQIPDVTKWLSSKKFSIEIGSDSANPIAKLSKRIHFVRDHLLGAK